MADIQQHFHLNQDFTQPIRRHPSPPATPFAPPDATDGNNNYRFELNRLRTFENWPVPFMKPAKLAATGFYYTGEGDKVRCFECHVEICQWVEGDNPMSDHQRWSGRCRFIRNIPCGNVPIGVDPSTIPHPVPRSRDVCGPYGIEYRPGSGPDCHPSPSDFQLPSTAKLGSLGLSRSKVPAHPQYASHEARLRTFGSWPKSMPQTKEQLADAGFYYTGKGDQTLCYHCGGGLKDWEPNDDPWEQHAKWFSKCCYLLTVKGHDYVNRVKGLEVPPLSLEETMQMNLPTCIKKVERVPEAEPEDKNSESNPGPSGSQNRSQECQESASSSQEIVPLAKVAYGNEPVDDARLCKICYTEELGVVFLPCGHMVACVKCAPSLTTCAVCRQPFSMTVRAFLS